MLFFFFSFHEYLPTLRSLHADTRLGEMWEEGEKLDFHHPTCTPLVLLFQLSQRANYRDLRGEAERRVLEYNL